MIKARSTCILFLTFLFSAMAAAQCSLPTVSKTVHICAPTSGATVSSPVTFSASAFDSAARVTAMAIYLDNVKVYTVNSNQLNTSLAIATGTHTAVIKAWDASGASFSSSVKFTVGSTAPPPPPPSGASCTLSTVDPSVTVCTPANNATVTSPVHVNAGSTDSSFKVTAMQIYLDGTLVYKNSLNYIDTDLTIASGVHKITVKGWDATGRSFSQAVFISVSSTETAPTVTMTASPASITSGQSSILNVSAQNAASVVVTNNVDSTSTTLSGVGGTVTVSPTVTTTYTATATNSAGAKATATSTVTVSTSTGTGDIKSINHIIFYSHENRSFDSYFGMLNPYRQANGFTTSTDGRVYSVDGVDDKLQAIFNLDDEGGSHYLFNTTSSCQDDMTSAWLESFGQVNRWDFGATRKILMDGFVHVAENFAKSGSGSGTFSDTTGDRAMAYFRHADPAGNPQLNYYYYMASQFALSDRWFAPVASKTIPNRLATLTGGTTQGYTHDPIKDDKTGQLVAKTIFQLLDEHGISWKIYYEQTNADGTPTTEFSYFTYANNFIHKNADGSIFIDSTHVAPISQYFTDVQNGTLPAFAYINKKDNADEHPGSGTSVFTGQQDTAKIVNALMYSPSWKDSVFFFTFDEPGGPYDHVPPVPGHTNDYTSSSLQADEGDVSPIAVNPDSYLPCVPTTAGVYSNHCDLRPADPGAKSTDAAAQSGFAAQIGARVPNFIISPFAKPHYVGHKAMDHTAVIRFLEARYGLSPLTARDAAQPDLLDFFDFQNPPWATPPPQAQLPVPPSQGTSCHPATLH